MRYCISGCGLFTPPQSISNEELVASFNRYVDDYNVQQQTLIEQGACQALAHSEAAFIEKASGIKQRYVMEKSGILDPQKMHPDFKSVSPEENTLQCDMALAASEEALAKASRCGQDIDAVICACSNMQRSYPAMAIEIQYALGSKGFAFDLNVACSSATFGLGTALSFISSGMAKRVLVVNPEICTGHLNFKDRDSHFIFGDAATALVIEAFDQSEQTTDCFEIIGTKLNTSFSNNIRNDGGFLYRCEPEATIEDYPLFKQNGRKVFKDVVPMVSKLILSHLKAHHLNAEQVKRLWLHQANANMNRLIASKVYGGDVSFLQAPQVLDKYANTSSAGSVIAFHQYHDDFKKNEIGLLCSFGAGYSVGCVLLRKVN